MTTDGLGEAIDGDDGTEEMRASRNLGVPSREAMDKFTDFSESLTGIRARYVLISVDLPIDTDEHKSAVASDPHLRLMLQLVSFERTFDDMGKFLLCLAGGIIHQGLD